MWRGERGISAPVDFARWLNRPVLDLVFAMRNKLW